MLANCNAYKLKLVVMKYFIFIVFCPFLVLQAQTISDTHSRDTFVLATNNNQSQIEDNLIVKEASAFHYVQKLDENFKIAHTEGYPTLIEDPTAFASKNDSLPNTENNNSTMNVYFANWDSKDLYLQLGADALVTGIDPISLENITPDTFRVDEMTMKLGVMVKF